MEKLDFYRLTNLNGKSQIDVINSDGSHSGSDPLICNEIFIGPDPTCTVNRAATIEEGIDAVITGVAVYESALTGKSVFIDKRKLPAK